MALRVVQYRPRLGRIEFSAHDPVRPDPLQRSGEIKDLQEQTRLVRRWIIFDTAPFETHEAGASHNLGVVARLLLG